MQTRLAREASAKTRAAIPGVARRQTVPAAQGTRAAIQGGHRCPFCAPSQGAAARHHRVLQRLRGSRPLATAPARCPAPPLHCALPIARSERARSGCSAHTMFPRLVAADRGGGARGGRCARTARSSQHGRRTRVESCPHRHADTGAGESPFADRHADTQSKDTQTDTQTSPPRPWRRTCRGTVRPHLLDLQLPRRRQTSCPALHAGTEFMREICFCF